MDDGIEEPGDGIAEVEAADRMEGLEREKEENPGKAQNADAEDGRKGRLDHDLNALERTAEGLKEALEEIEGEDNENALVGEGDRGATLGEIQGNEGGTEKDKGDADNNARKD